jgi:hypothetical protein
MHTVSTDLGLGCTPRAVSDDDLNAFCAGVRALRIAYATNAGFTNEHVLNDLRTVTFERNARYARIVVGKAPHRIVHCYVDVSNGDIHKGSARGPVARGKRGNMFIDGLRSVNEHGTRYLR